MTDTTPRPQDCPPLPSEAASPAERRHALDALFARIDEIERAMGVTPIRGVVGPRIAY